MCPHWRMQVRDQHAQAEATEPGVSASQLGLHAEATYLGDEEAIINETEFCFGT